MANKDEIRQQAAAEVLELGEMLFDSAIDVATRQPTEGEEIEETLRDEMRAAADEFFMAVRLLLGTERQSTEG
jgi:hypothetical protein